MSREIRVRFAPSPTGALHIGGVRTALYNYLFARKNQGKFLIRIEDTDQNRFVPNAEAYIFEALAWLGLQADESPIVGGPHAPYRQSERKEIYWQYAQQLLDSGSAYYAFDTARELETMRKELEAAKSSNPSYNPLTRMRMKNSLTISKEDTEACLNSGQPYVIRFKMPAKEEIRFNDLIRGSQNVHSSSLDDKVLMKSDGMPTYHLANVVDDYLMQISHVIRGEEWLPSAPLHVLLYRALGWESVMPQFAHLPLLLNPDGKGKLSKRKAKEYGFPVFPLDWTEPETGEQSTGFRESGYLPETLLNFLALLGWNDGTEKELFSLEELIQAFSIDRIHKTGAKFDIEKAKWFNHQYLKAKSDDELTKMLLVDLQKNNISTENVSIEKASKISALMKDRAIFPTDLWKGATFLFQKPEKYDEEVISKKWNREVDDFLQSLKEIFASTPIEWAAENIKNLIHNLCEDKEIKMGKMMQPLRVVISGLGTGPDLMLMMEILGKEEVVSRIERAIMMLLKLDKE